MKLKYIIIVFAILLTSCNTSKKCANEYFGLPDGTTGMSAENCQPACGCKKFSTTSFSSAAIEALKKWTLKEPLELLPFNPYQKKLPTAENCLCAVVIEDEQNKIYDLQNFKSEKAAKRAGATVTHYGPCGMCSSLKDLAVYIESPSLGAPIRSCAMKGLLSTFDNLVTCIKEVGFSDPCAQIWAFNTKNTKRKCFNACFKGILKQTFGDGAEPFNYANGDLTPCVKCDEDKSGAVFKAYAGRTRRNSGLPSGICRTCEEVKKVKHQYFK